MKSLVQTTLWAPDHVLNQSRLDTIKTHLDSFLNYRGDWDFHIVNNSQILDAMSQDFIENMKKIHPEKVIYYDFYPENKGWCFARNRGITRFMQSDDYDNIILIDCDVWCYNNNWIINAQLLNKNIPTFMIRKDEPERHSPFLADGILVWKFGEWLGNINVMNKEVINKVGGYDNITFPQNWGFHDCEYGRRLLKSGLFDKTGYYLSMGGAECESIHDDQYQQIMGGVKFEMSHKYLQVFTQTESDVFAGIKPLFFNYEC